MVIGAALPPFRIFAAEAGFEGAREGRPLLSNALEGAWLADDSTLPLKRWEQKELVQSLRRQGLSYREILSRVPFSLSKSTMSDWCKDIELTPEQLDRLDQLYQVGSYRGRLLGPKTTQRRRNEAIEAIRTTARSEISELTEKEFWLAGLMLYWAEGTKRREVSISNSDPRMIAFIMRWFRKVCNVPEHRFRAQLHLHSGQTRKR